MILRLWRGWADTDRAKKYDEILTGEVAPAILDRGIDGLHSLEVWTRLHEERQGDVEFLTAMRFDDLAAVRRFTRGDHRISVVPPRAREVLARFDAHSQHYELRAKYPNFPRDGEGC